MFAPDASIGIALRANPARAYDSAVLRGCSSSLRAAALSAALLVSGVAASAPQPTDDSVSAKTWLKQAISDLAAEDPAVRDAATERLAGGGAAVRPAVLAIFRRPPCAEVRARAASILIQLPWARPDDPPVPRQLLGEYNQKSEELRVRLIGRLAEAHDTGGREALVRLLQEEPSATVRWAIVAQCRQLHDEALLELLRQFDPGEDAPGCVAVGYGWLQRDPRQMVAFMRRAVDVEWRRPTEDHPTNGDPAEIRDTGGRGEMDRVFDLLYARAMSSGNVDEAADLLRKLAWRHLAPPDDDEGLPLPLLNLFSLHALYGPLAGFDQDARAFAEYLGEPELIYSVGRMHLRNGQAFLADACYRAAGAASVGRQLTHKRVGEFLLRRGWYDLAEREFLAVLASTGPEKEVHDADAYVGLSRAAGGLGDDAQAAVRLRTALDLARSLNPPRKISNEPAFLAEITWHELRAAMEKNDRAEIERTVSELSKAPPMNAETTLDRIAAYKRLGEQLEAKRLFEPLYDEWTAALKIDPHNAELLNNLAWTCARCGEHPDEAVKAAADAISAAPGNAAYLDTAAEANFVAGHREEAVRYETEALRLQPGDQFMLKQLKRFKDAPLPGK